MAKTPIVRPISIANASITVAVLGVFVLAGWAIGGSLGIAIGALLYIITSRTLRYLFCKTHFDGIRLCQQKKFEMAIPEFQRSFDFFQDHEWIDKYRPIILLSSSAMSFREMALISLGFCYSQLGDGQQARHHYEMCAQMFPENGMAEAALNLMDAVSSSD